MATGWTIVTDLVNELGLYLVMMEIEINLKTSKDEEVHSIEERVSELINADVYEKQTPHLDVDPGRKFLFGSFRNYQVIELCWISELGDSDRIVSIKFDLYFFLFVFLFRSLVCLQFY